VPHQPDSGGLLIRNRVSQVQFDNQYILERIRVKLMNFCNLAQCRWFWRVCDLLEFSPCILGVVAI
jgi:hypothetical protein